jgi:HlyD family secretion protein
VLSKASGEIIELPFEEGDRVRRGDRLVRLDPDDEERNVRRNEAALISARARLEKARNELKLTQSNHKKALSDAQTQLTLTRTKLEEAEARHQRQEELHSRKLIPIEELQISRSALEQARSDLARAEAALEDAGNLPLQFAAREQDVKLAEVEVANAEIALEEVRERLAETEIVAPMDGVVTQRAVELGQVISSPLNNVGGGTILMTLSDLSALYLVTAVDETDIGGIKLGQRAELATDAYPQERFEGQVAHIAPVGVSVSSVVTFDVKVQVTGVGLEKLKPGMTADVTIVMGESPDTHWVQSEAIQSENGFHYVEIVADDPTSLRRVPVEVGLTDGLRTEVRSGVSPGQMVRLHESDDLSAWERGEGASRPMRGGFGPFGRGIKKKS